MRIELDGEKKAAAYVALKVDNKGQKGKNIRLQDLLAALDGKKVGNEILGLSNASDLKLGDADVIFDFNSDGFLTGVEIIL